ncbi:Nitric oxide reductase FlRd-NAD(+) reductase [Carnimonas sp. R-84981]|uniref:nitrite reductase large subunit NirB n=1 Tax=Carnimonas bestiolae TaxID=3402172 RepID=UPI003EDBF4D4
MDKPTLIVIGNGMAGARLIEQLCEKAPGRFRIVVIGEEPQPAYNRIMLTPVLSGEEHFAGIVTHDTDWYRRHGVTLLKGTAVTAICRQAQSVTVGDRTLHYDHLVIATGSRSVMPSLPGAASSGIHGFRTQQDVDAILATSYPKQPVVVIGGGVLGIEAAAALALRNMRVTLVNRSRHLMSQQLDSYAAQLLHDSLVARGVQVLTEATPATYLADSDGQVRAVMLDDGRTIAAERVVVAAGIQPNIALAQAAGLACEHGIVVNDALQTSDPRIFAIGECCQLGTLTPGLVAPCWQQAERLATQLAGMPPSSIEQHHVALRLKVTGLNLFCAGELNACEGDQVHTSFDPFDHHYRRLLIRDNQLRGVLLWGDISDGAHYLSCLNNTQPPPSQASLFGPENADSAESKAIKNAPILANKMRGTAMSKPVLAMVGHGMVGHHFLQQLVERELHLTYQIVVFAEETSPAYDRVHLSELFSGRTAESLTMVEEGFFEAAGIELRLGQGIDHIDKQRRYVVDTQGHQMAYDLLVLATGSYPFVPPIPGNDAEGCLVYRTLDDLAAIKSRAATASTGVVVGGGLLGLEAANALKNLGLDTHVVEFGPRLMGVQLDEDGARVLQQKIEALGVQVHTSKQTLAIEPGETSHYRMAFADGSDLETDLVLFSAGIRPNDRLARQSGLEIGARGGIVIDDQCRSSDSAIFAIGECAVWNNQTFGLVAPGYQMARTLADTLAGGEGAFAGADMSTKLKLLGVEVASLGDAHGSTPGSQCYRWVDGPAEVYKKIVVSKDRKRLLGAVLVGDSSDYDTLLQLMLNDMPLPAHPETLILPAQEGSAAPALGVAALPDSAQICSCHNVSKADIRAAVEDGCSDMSAIKAHTRAATGCGGCAALTKQIMDFTLTELGVEVKKDVCEHFAYSRQELYHLIRVGNIRSWEELLSKHGKGHGCEICKPMVGSILASCWNDYLLKPQHLPLQDTNDRFFANIQKDGTYSVVPRVPAGEITPEGLIAIGNVAKQYNLYTKITGGQRVDLFGARLEHLPEIWQQLIDAGFETGHAYGKSLRTVKSCVGSSWCRYGVQDSTALALFLENRYKGLRSPHKIKMAVSGCTRECAEAQSKDVGVIATEKGWNLFVCGNGGMKPRHADLLAQDISTELLIRTIDRFLMFYVRTADRLQRTSVWLNNLEGGMEYLRQVVLEDSLGIGAELEHEMSTVIDTYQCEWRTTLADPERLALFKTFVNSDQPDESVVMVPERKQVRPANHEERLALAVDATAPENDQAWVDVCDLSAIPDNAGVAARLAGQQVALFHLPHHPQRVFALSNREPNSDANVLSRGLVGDVKGDPIVISPLYKQRFRLEDGRNVESADSRLDVWPVKVEAGRVWVQSQPVPVDTNDTDIIDTVSL